MTARSTRVAGMNFAGSQAAMWFGHVVEVMEPAWKTGIVYVMGPDIIGDGWTPGYVCARRVAPIGPVARALLKMEI